MLNNVVYRKQVLGVVWFRLNLCELPRYRTIVSCCQKNLSFTILICKSQNIEGLMKQQFEKPLERTVKQRYSNGEIRHSTGLFGRSSPANLK